MVAVAGGSFPRRKHGPFPRAHSGVRARRRGGGGRGALAAARAPIGVTPMIGQNDDPALDFTKIFTAYTG
jgi:hypothetical protein